ncbi:MAG TPA: DUF4446 family protein [Marmoricola sp.]|nr:DUF4446 family protein [Marmoricola sp.]
MAFIALIVALLALAAGSYAVYLQRNSAAPAQNVEMVPEDVYALREEVAALRLDSHDALRHLAVVRYDAFGDMGGRLSWSMAVLDDHANGVVITSIHGRSDGRTYAKSVIDGACDQPLSPEESDAIAHARGAA